MDVRRVRTETPGRPSPSPGSRPLWRKSSPPPAHTASAPHRPDHLVHGHDGDARDQLEIALHRLDLEPFILMNSSGEGRTIIEALEGYKGGLRDEART